MTIFQIVLLVVIATLLVMAFITSARFTKGPLDIKALKSQLLFLKSTFNTLAFVDPRLERAAMEPLHNRVKTSTDSLVITNDLELKELVQHNCSAIEERLLQPQLENRSDWIKFYGMMSDFKQQYFIA